MLGWREPGLDLVPVEIKGPLISMGIESGTAISNRLNQIITADCLT